MSKSSKLNPGVMSSELQDWATPISFVIAVEQYLRIKFDTDVCAYSTNAKCTNFYTEADDGLTKEWTGICWMNPPYNEVAKRLQYAYEQSKKHDSTIVCLVPARPDTKWFHDIACKGSIIFLKGRIQFEHPTKTAGSPAFPLMLVIFNNRPTNFSTWDWK